MNASRSVLIRRIGNLVGPRQAHWQCVDEGLCASEHRNSADDCQPGLSSVDGLDTARRCDTQEKTPMRLEILNLYVEPRSS